MAPCLPGFAPTVHEYPEWGLSSGTRGLWIYSAGMEATILARHLAYHVAEPALLEFYEYGADGHPEETRPSTFLASLLLLKSPRLDFHMKRQSNHRSQTILLESLARMRSVYVFFNSLSVCGNCYHTYIPNLTSTMKHLHTSPLAFFAEKANLLQDSWGFAALQILSVETL